MTTSTRLSRLVRSLLVGFLVVALLSVASAQSVAPRVVQVEAVTTSVIGRAPVVTVAVENVTRPGEAALVGDALRATTTTTDPDGDTITATSYRWLRGGTEIASTNTYTVVEADRGLTLSVEAIATTDSAITDPASGTGSTSVAVTNNTVPTAAPTITGTPTVGTQMTGNPGYADAENDPAGTHTYQWYRSANASGTPRTAIANANSATYTPVTEDQAQYLVFGVIPVSTVAPTTGVEAFAVSAVVPGTGPNIINVQISGEWRVGGVITATFDLVDDEGDLIDEANMEYGWLVSSSPTGGGPVQVPGETGRTYTIRPEDIGANRRIWFSVEKAATLTGVPNSRLRPTSPAGQWQASRQGLIEGRPPTMTAPLINGTVAVGQTLTAVPQGYDDPDGDAAGTHLFQWFQVDNMAGDNPVQIPSATSASYVVRVEDFAKFLMVRVTPVSATGTPNTGTAVTAVTSASATGTAPTATPTITGTPTVGTQLTGNPGYADAENDPQDTHTYQWYRSANASGTPRTAITNATSDTYTPVTEDQAQFLVFGVIPVSTVAPTTGVEAFAVTAVVPGTAPSITNLALSGDWRVGGVITATFDLVDPEGDQIDESGMVYSWYVSVQPNGTGGPAVVPGVTGRTFTIRPEDIGSNRRVWFSVDKAKTLTGVPNEQLRPTSPSGQWQVSRTGLIEGRPPTMTTPLINGTVAVGQTLTAVPQGYDDPDGDAAGTHLYAWFQIDNVAGDNPVQIPSATSATYVVRIDDLAKFLMVRVTPVSATGTPNTGAAVTAVTNNSVSGSAPTATPTITGAVAVGTQLTGNPGYNDVENDPQGTHTYQWYRSANSSGTPRTAITNATSTTYTPVAEDQAQYLVFGVIPVSTVAPTTGVEAFAVSAVVPGTAPNIINVAISGVWRVGEVLTGTFDLQDAENDQIDEANMQYQWLVSSSPTGGGPVAVPGETGRTYTIRPEDVGTNRRVWFSVEKAATLTGVPNERLRPTSPAGQWQATRQGLIEGHAPTMTTPLINGTVAVGQTLTAVPQGFDDPDGDAQGTHLYAWFQVDNVAGDNPVAIGSATSDTYVVRNVDQAKFLMVRITPVSATGTPNTGTAVTRVTSIAVPGTAPNIINVAISGDWRVGGVITAAFDLQDPEGDLIDEANMQYQWLVSSSPTGGGPVVVPGETGRTFTLRPEDIGTNRRVWFSVEKAATLTGVPNERLRPTSPSGQWQASRQGVIDGRPPTMTTPLINGTVAVGQALTAVPQGFDDPDGDSEGTHLFQWFQVDNVAGDIPVQIPSATSATYVVRVDDVAKFLMVRVTPVSATGTPNTGAAVTAVTSTPAVTSPPAATQLSISGTLDYGQTVEAIWSYSDPDNHSEGTHTYQWYTAHDAAGTTKVAVPGATAKTHVLTPSDQGMYVGFSVTPRDSTGDTGTTETFFTSKEVRYRVTGNWDFQGSNQPPALIPISISNRSGNAPANLKVGLWRGYRGYSDSTANCTLIAPNGTRFAVTFPSAANGAAFTTIDASGSPANGTWTLEVKGTKPGITYLNIAQVTLEFTP
ncbi:hypothetical protein [Noviluteimonas gilva]|uniref:P/Homo B domain-containing protein n=1 Tax=Noviluteimonas gilva TaxID=2682097 RepID=A0A7C9I2R5_9GAMM|nr:hypothetical protein [Lysobacter gilvus]MUV12649.1 hypothetical protein [Lysobacter gilvus]